MKAATPQQVLAPPLITANDRRKRLGQFYTGSALANLLAALARTDRDSAVIDPMAGTGDMLIASAGEAKMVAAIEIDPVAYSICAARIEQLKPATRGAVLGNAFSVESLQKLPSLEWDLVITNPPYVRYQEGGAGATIEEFELPSAAQVRLGLIEAIDFLPALDDEDRRGFRQLAENYSGLADLAVPSWILCAALVRPGGALAVVVPNAWLSRDYASPIHHLLGRWFDVEAVIEDADAAWFKDALVRTTLLVARRTRSSGGHPHIKVHRESADGRSVVGAVYPTSPTPDSAFADDVRQWRIQRRINKRPFLSGHWVPAEQVTSRGQQWKLEAAPGVVEGPPWLPAPVAGLVKDPTRLASIESLGWRVGQGLRSGANQFFYVDQISSGHDGRPVIVTSKTFDHTTLPVPADSILPALRRQSELPSNYVINSSALRGRVLFLDDYALAEDLASALVSPYRTVPDELAGHIRRAGTLNIGTGDAARFIPSLSAVAPNDRPARAGAPPRFWYQLPKLATRHRPDLAVARINYGHTKTFLNPARRTVIDANFSTLWRTDSVGPGELAMLAALNSSWTVGVLELGSTVLGGGALKVEAANIRRLLLPARNDPAWPELARLGRHLSERSSRDWSPLLDEIDSVLSAAVFASDRGRRRLLEIKSLAAEHLRSRSPK